ncbi:MAG: hypothetical protein UR93_C0005G0008 [Berkelbacteria bacterium GW2011_GWA2_35_9]|uniref:Uncharacterized protein n=1 Tax=Berkelbacteria bacterium GW2011_GWA2_35_9 TaxID=1618333 RepID=A0A0G0GB56_9BACT|nr:MAG: hypothetical protein UR93_C0005G0008 [Berkelbacteria bacterium GW2011_GWA2_35_9]
MNKKNALFLINIFIVVILIFYLSAILIKYLLIKKYDNHLRQLEKNMITEYKYYSKE